MTSNGMQSLTDRERMYHGKYTGALRQLHHAERRAQDALRRADALQQEIHRLRDELASQSPTIAQEPLCEQLELIDDDYSTTDIELTRLAQTLAELKREDHERWARHICAALDYVEALDRELRRETGRDRRATRQIDPLRRQGKRAA
jgi:chromosome segregation ATPase